MAEEISVEQRVGAMITGEELPEAEIAEEITETIPEEAGQREETEELEATEEITEEAAEEPAEEYLDLEYDGITYQVPPALKDAFLRNADYTQKTQAVSEQRKEIEMLQKQVETTQNEQTFITDIQPELNNLGLLQAQIQQMEAGLQQNLASMTSEQMFKTKIEIDGMKDQMNAFRQGLEVKYKEFEEAQKQSYNELLEQGAQTLKKSIPDWNEGKAQQVREFAVQQGFNQQEVNSIIDPRHVKVLWAASQYERLQEKAKPAAEQIKSAPMIKTKSRNPMPKDTRDKLDYRNKLQSKNLNTRQKAKVIQDEMAKRFG
tara:strand:+ start:3917 stop:4867 length:951 start_codon:yes stop_codon:yes gene_type:complete